MQCGKVAAALLVNGASFGGLFDVVLGVVVIRSSLYLAVGRRTDAFIGAACGSCSSFGLVLMRLVSAAVLLLLVTRACGRLVRLVMRNGCVSPAGGGGSIVAPLWGALALFLLFGRGLDCHTSLCRVPDNQSVESWFMVGWWRLTTVIHWLGWRWFTSRW